MKIKAWLTSWLTSSCISFGAVSALVTTFSFSDVPLPELGIYCVLLCAVCAWAFLTKRGPVVLFGLMGVLLCYGLFWRGLWDSLQAVAYRINTVYNIAYRWGELDISDEVKAFSLIPAMAFLGTLPAVSLSWAVGRRKKLLFPLIIALLPLYPCFVIMNPAPEGWCFLLILAAALVLILTQALRRLDQKTGQRITAVVLIPAILLSVFLMSSVPEDGYWEKFPALQALAWETPGQSSTQGEGQSHLGMPENNRIDLLSAGFPTGLSTTVMSVRSSFRGFVYLRYQSFDSYNGTQWLATGLPEDPDFWPGEEDLGNSGYISITTTKPYEGLFIPYYAQNGRYLLLQNGMQPNSEKLTEYRVSIGTLGKSAYAEQTPDLTSYLRLPEATRAAAQKILQENDLQTPEDILQYVKDSATYSLMTAPPPEDTEDFAIWFLQNGKTGFCVHFATAAAVLLRAAGYPARYVTGYALTARGGRIVYVKERNAHAWVEYAEPESGYIWKVFEATPADFLPDSTPSTTEPTDPFAPTQPSETSGAELQEPTDPSDPDKPSEPVTDSATLPSDQEGEQHKQKPSINNSWLLRWVVGIGCLIAAMAVLWLQYCIRFRLRQKKLRTGSHNAMALACWREILRLDGLLKTEPPEQLLKLAEKARFSQHVLTRKELLQLRQYLRQQRKVLQSFPAWKQLFLRLLWAI